MHERWTLFFRGVVGLIAFVGLTSPALADDTPLCELSITILDVESDEGSLMVAVADHAEAFEGDVEPTLNEKVAIDGGRGHVSLTALPCGKYAVKVFHDENSNEDLDTNFVGFPKESFGFSNDAMGKFGPPSFEQAMFEIRAPRHEIVIHMK